jgi:uncharacterized protein
MNTTPSLAPVSSSERIDALDVLRGVALFGILLMNITAFGLYMNAYSDPTVMGGADGWNLRSWIATNMFFEGTMRAMFSVLFGAGMVLLVSRMEKNGGGINVADIYYRRTLWLILFGVIHAYLILWFGEILFAYGIFGLMIFPFRHTATKKLIAIILILTVAGSALKYNDYTKAMKNFAKFQLAETYASEESIPDDIKEGKEAWAGLVSGMKPDEKKKEQFVQKMHQGYLGVMMHLAPINRLVQTSFNYDYNPWDVLPMMLLGIVLFRMGIITAVRSYKTYALMMLAGYCVGLPINYYETMTVLNANFAPVSILQAELTYPFGRIAMAMGHIGLIMMACKSSYFYFLKTGLAAVGKMALTNYIMHSVICAIVFTGIGFSLFGKLQRYELYFVVLSIWSFQFIVSPLWLRYFQFGPLEWLWRTLTYQKVQPFVKNKPAPPLDVVSA